MTNDEKLFVEEQLLLLSQSTQGNPISNEKLAEVQRIMQNFFVSQKVDYHVHSNGSHDATGKIGEVIKAANKVNVGEVAITNHNEIMETQIYLKKLNLRIREENEELNKNTPEYNPSLPMNRINGVNVIPAVEITCVIPGVKSEKNKPLKIHMLVYGLKLEEPSPLLKLLKAKHENDMLVDFGLFRIIEKKYGIHFTEEKIKDYIIEKRQQTKGFGRFGADDVIDFLKYNNIKLSNSYKEVKELLKSAPGPERMQLNVSDVIKLAHASGGMCVLAHPGVNLNRVNMNDNSGLTKEEKKAQIVRKLLEYGIDGFELFYNSKNTDVRERKSGQKTTIEIIKDEVRDFVASGKNRGNEIVFTAGSDTHFMEGDLNNDRQTLASTNKGDITSQGVKKFRKELAKLYFARLQGKITHRKYKTIPKEEIIQIQQQYTLTAQNFERTFLEGVDNFTFTRTPQVIKPSIKHKNSNRKNYPPKIAKNFQEFEAGELALTSGSKQQMSMEEELKRIDAINKTGGHSK